MGAIYHALTSLSSAHPAFSTVPNLEQYSLLHPTKLFQILGPLDLVFIAMRLYLPNFLVLAAAVNAWLPANKIRGVNLGSLFVFEKWMAEEEWKSMDCGELCSEFDCVSHLGQDTANEVFRKHWATWITEDDFDQMQKVGLNAVRIPVGYWMKEDLVYTDSEHFPQGGIDYLDTVAGWASARNLYIVIDLHGAPGAQNGGNPSTGQVSPENSLRPF